MAKKPTPTTDRAPAISAKEAKNALPSDLHKQAADDLYDEAKHWLDGSDIETEAQAEGVEKLLNLARAAISAATADKAEEKRPHLDANIEIEARYRPITEHLNRIVQGCRSALTPWREKIEAEKRRQAAEAARAAEEMQRRAEEATTAARGNLGAMEIAEGAQEEAKRLDKAAARQERDAGKGLRMRTVWDTEIVDNMACLKHYLKERPQDILDLLQRLAREDVRGGARALPGCTITSRKEAY